MFIQKFLTRRLSDDLLTNEIKKEIGDLKVDPASVKLAIERAVEKLYKKERYEHQQEIEKTKSAYKSAVNETELASAYLANRVELEAYALRKLEELKNEKEKN